MKRYALLLFLAAAALTLGCEEVDDGLNQSSEAECITDADCATGGCSGQVCTTAEAAPGIITTCEYREEYSCLEYTSCGCVAGRCAWGETAEYDECLAGIS